MPSLGPISANPISGLQVVTATTQTRPATQSPYTLYPEDRDSQYYYLQQNQHPRLTQNGIFKILPQDTQRYVPDRDDTFWWNQSRRWPTPVSHDSPSTRQDTQRYAPFPDDTPWWVQFRRHPIPTQFLSSREGTCGVYNVIGSGGHSGQGRIRNNIAGYNVYVGVNALPDLTQAPTFFSALPITVSTSPPGLGTKTYNVLVRKQDQYGLESQNQYPFSFTINAAGGIVYPPISAPANLKVYNSTGGNVRVLAQYPGFTTDANPASQWYVWVTAAPPTVGTTIPTLVVNASSILAVTPGPFTQGSTYYVTVALYRQADGAFSTTLQTTITIPTNPVQVVPVPSGYQS